MSASIWRGAPGALHLHGDLLPVRKRRAVHLADRGRGDRGRIEVQEEPLERVAQIVLDHPLGLLERERAHVVLERSQLDDDVRRDDVGPRREQLPELDEGRAELVEQLAQMLAARRARSLGLRGRGDARLGGAPGQEVGELVRLEEVPEAVPHHDLRDLREASEAAGCRLGHGVKCGMRRGVGARAASGGSLAERAERESRRARARQRGRPSEAGERDSDSRSLRRFVHGPGGTRSDSTCRYASPTAGRSVRRSTQM